MSGITGNWKPAKAKRVKPPLPDYGESFIPGVDVSRETHPDAVYQTNQSVSQTPGFRPEAYALNQLIDEMTPEQAQKMLGVFGNWALGKAKGAAETVGAALTSRPDLEDIARGTGQGLRDVGESTISLPKDLQDPAWVLRDALAQRIGVTPEAMAAYDRFNSRFNPYQIGLNFLMDRLPTGEQVTEATTPYLGAPYEAKTPAGQVMQFGAEQADPTTLIPGGWLAKRLKGLF